jgi:pantoate--beta-alanine ligase
MRTISSVPAMQRLALKLKSRGKRIGFVPTMGFLHDGHMSLIKRARQAVGKTGIVIVSIYVNPTQFGPTEDFSRYPRDLARDQKLCRQAGADIIFAPSDKEMYAGRDEGKYSTYVVEEKLSQVMEGAARPTHFRGVTTIVAKLFNIVMPDAAVFGAKDFQQAAIIQRMVKDLNFPIKIIVAPIVREADGLAMSSRNKYLVGDLRPQAVVLSQAIQKTKEELRRKKEEIGTARVKQQLKNFIEQQPDARVDYIEIFDPETLQPSAQARPGLQIALAVFVGKTRLIDNARL